jgi:arabinofuranosyltransferase
VVSETSIERGATYVLDFLVSYWLVPFVLLFIILIGHSANNAHKEIYLVAVLVLLWFVYVIGVGGDFMEFRMMLPALSYLSIIMAWVTIMLIKRRVFQIALVLVALCGSAYHAATFKWDGKFGPESITQLKWHLTPNGGNWMEIGRTLRREFDYNSTVIIGTGASGAIPYYSGLPTIDLFGLNDEEIAKEGASWTDVPGHQRRAFLSDLVRRKVNLIIGGMNPRSSRTEPTTTYTLKDMEAWPTAIVSPQDIPAESCIVEIPTPDGRTFSAWYLVRSPIIDDRIREQHWQTHPISTSR